MDEKMQYADMLDIPVNTCTITDVTKKKKPAKKRRVDSEQVKAKLLDKINATTQDSAASPTVDEVAEQTQPSAQTGEGVISAKKPKFKFKFSVVTLQILIIGALIATIFITNSVYPNSGLNVFMRGVLGTEQVSQVDNREFTDFAPVISIGDGNVVLSEGVITNTGSGSVYSSCDGKVTDLTLGEDGKYTMTIAHSDNFVSVFSGIDYAYSQVGDKVFSNIPVGFVRDEVSMCFKDSSGVIIDDFTVQDGSVIWAV